MSDNELPPAVPGDQTNEPLPPRVILPPPENPDEIPPAVTMLRQKLGAQEEIQNEQVDS